jgi:hypothetical protein
MKSMMMKKEDITHRSQMKRKKKRKYNLKRKTLKRKEARSQLKSMEIGIKKEISKLR